MRHLRSQQQQEHQPAPATATDASTISWVVSQHDGGEISSGIVDYCCGASFSWTCGGKGAKGEGDLFAVLIHIYDAYIRCTHTHTDLLLPEYRHHTERGERKRQIIDQASCRQQNKKRIHHRAGTGVVGLVWEQILHGSTRSLCILLLLYVWPCLLLRGILCT